MATFFSGNAGYRGLVSLNDAILLATAGQINMAHNPINSSGVWGAGYQNAAEIVAYADNYLQLDGNMGCELTAGAAFAAIKLFAFTNRGAAAGTPLSIFPEGEHGFTGVAWGTSLSFSCATDAVLTADMNWASYISEDNVIIPGDNSNSELGASGGELPMAYNGLYPYWACNCYGGADGGTLLKDIINWSASYNSSIEFLKCCGKGTAMQDDNPFPAPLSPDYLILGAMSADGSYTVFAIKDEFDPNSFHKQNSFAFEVASPAEPDPTAAHTIFFPKIVKSQGGTSVQTGSSYITCDFSFTGIGDGKNPPMALDPSTEPDPDPTP